MAESLYDARGVSTSKSDVHQAIAHHDKGLFPGAFCKIIPDYLTSDPDYCLLVHADGAGTKVIVTYLASKAGFFGLWERPAIDSLAMNLNDAICVGALGPFIVNQTIGRNKFLVSGPEVASIIQGCQDLCDLFTELGFPIYFAGGETADLADNIRTVTVDNTLICRMPRSQVIDASKMEPGDVIVGFSSTGKTTWEDVPNAGLGSNGFTNGRHDVLSSHYRDHFPEAYAPEQKKELVYRGKYRLKDHVPESVFTVGEMLTSPTRVYLPLLAGLLKAVPPMALHGLIHCSGGGQTKIGRFGKAGNLYRKHSPFPVTPEFALLKDVPGMTWREMYRVYNMGHQLEAIVPGAWVNECLTAAAQCGIQAQVVGDVAMTSSEKREVHIMTPDGKQAEYQEGRDW